MFDPLKKHRHPRRGRAQTLKRLNSLDLSFDSEDEESRNFAHSTTKFRPTGRNTLKDLNNLLDFVDIEGLTDQDQQEIAEIEAQLDQLDADNYVKVVKKIAKAVNPRHNIRKKLLKTIH